MARRDPQPELPGNDGRWFLELVGLVEATDGARASLARLAAETTAPPSEVDSPFSAPSTTLGATMVVEGLGTAATEVQGLALSPPTPDDEPRPPVPPTATTPASPPDEALVVEPTRRWWRVVIPVVLLVLVLGGLALLVLRRSERVATTIAAHRHALVELRNTLPEAQASLAALTDPTTPPSALVETLPAVTALDAAAHDAAVLATEPLPSPLPFEPPDGYELLEDLRDRLSLHGMEGGDLAAALGHVFAYRSTVEELLAPGDLPLEADRARRAELAVALATDFADDAEAVASLPEDSLFADVRVAADRSLDRYGDWQDDYLGALEAEDPDRTAALLAELEELRAELRRELLAALAEARTALDARIIDLARRLEEDLAATAQARPSSSAATSRSKSRTPSNSL